MRFTGSSARSRAPPRDRSGHGVTHTLSLRRSSTRRGPMRRPVGRGTLWSGQLPCKGSCETGTHLPPSLVSGSTSVSLSHLVPSLGHRAYLRHPPSHMPVTKTAPLPVDGGAAWSRSPSPTHEHPAPTGLSPSVPVAPSGSVHDAVPSPLCQSAEW